MKKRNIAASVITAAMLAGFAASVYADNAIKLFFNGKELKSDVPPKIVDDRVLVPVRVISEALGATVTWDDKASSVIIDADGAKAQTQQIQRLEQALAPKDPLSSARSWAEGVKMRNGAWQYAVMSPELRKEMYTKFADNFWSTGVSSPWIASYEAIEQFADGNIMAGYEVVFTYTDSTQATFKEKEYITVKNYEGSWLVSSIEKIEVKGKITKLTTDTNNELKSVFIEADAVERGFYDKANVIIGKNTKIYKGYSNEELNIDDLKEGTEVEAAFVEGPRLMIYPVSALAKTIRVTGQRTE